MTHALTELKAEVCIFSSYFGGSLTLLEAVNTLDSESAQKQSPFYTKMVYNNTRLNQ